MCMPSGPTDSRRCAGRPAKTPASSGGRSRSRQNPPRDQRTLPVAVLAAEPDLLLAGPIRRKRHLGHRTETTRGPSRFATWPARPRAPDARWKTGTDRSRLPECVSASRVPSGDTAGSFSMPPVACQQPACRVPCPSTTGACRASGEASAHHAPAVGSQLNAGARPARSCRRRHGRTAPRLHRNTQNSAAARPPCRAREPRRPASIRPARTAASLRRSPCAAERRRVYGTGGDPGGDDSHSL